MVDFFRPSLNFDGGLSLKSLLMIWRLCCGPSPILKGFVDPFWVCHVCGQRLCRLFSMELRATASDATVVAVELETSHGSATPDDSMGAGRGARKEEHIVQLFDTRPETF